MYTAYVIYIYPLIHVSAVSAIRPTGRRVSMRIHLKITLLLLLLLLLLTETKKDSSKNSYTVSQNQTNH
jgi:hypothetical protein